MYERVTEVYKKDIMSEKKWPQFEHSSLVALPHQHTAFVLQS